MTESIASAVLDPLRSRVARGRLRNLAAVLAACLTTSCVSAVDLLDATTPLVPGAYTELGEASGSSSGFSVFLLQFGASDSIASARDEALAASGADALVRVSVESRDFHLLNLFGMHRATVRGTAVKRSP